MPHIDISYNNTIPSDTMSQAGQWKVGTFYSYCAVSAGTYCPPNETPGTVSASDICPKGWHLPSGGIGGEYYRVYGVYDSNNSIFRTVMHLPYSGIHNSNSAGAIGGAGLWWTRTYSNYNKMYRLYASDSGIGSGESVIERFYGLTVRCIAK